MPRCCGATSELVLPTSKSATGAHGRSELLELYKDFCKNYPIITIEDPFDQDDWDNTAAFTSEGVSQVPSSGCAVSAVTTWLACVVQTQSTLSVLNCKLRWVLQVVGDDLLVTNPKRVKEAIEKKACNALLLKVNQIGTVTESIQAVKMAKVDHLFWYWLRLQHFLPQPS